MEKQIIHNGKPLISHYRKMKFLVSTSAFLMKSNLERVKKYGALAREQEEWAFFTWSFW